jgi:protein-S-isoprenylcysteine O-methyltransferase Ste14
MDRKMLIGVTLGSGVLGWIVATLWVTHKSALPWPAWLSIDPTLHGQGAFLVLAVFTWALVSVYWEVEAKKAAQTRHRESGGSRSIHVLLVNAALLMVVAPIRGFGRYLPVSTTIMLIGLAIEWAGVFVAVWARRNLGRHWSGAVAIKVEHQLIRTGPYKMLRHPIYTGLLLMYVGPAIVTGERLALVGVALALIAYRRKIRLEEAALDGAFGSIYNTYRRETWALVPWVY